MTKSRIEWCDEVWNPTTGCSKVSAGCQHCYAERVAKRFWKDRKFTDIQCHPERLEQPLHWRKPRRVFVDSMSDLFHEDVPDTFILDVLDVIERCPKHTFMILTKRAERMKNFFWGESGAGAFAPAIPNLWLGVSVEDQQAADTRIPALLETPAAVRFVSCEPLLGPVDLDLGPKQPCSHIGCYRHVSHPCEGCGRLQGFLPIDWVICGGESGPDARPMHPDWARSLRDQCQAAGVPFFFKQWGEWAPAIFRMEYPTSQPFVFPDGALVMRAGKKKAGRLLDGREWNEFPGE